MAKPKKEKAPVRSELGDSAILQNPGVMIDQPITETLEKNFMPYAMSVIISRAIPEIDGFKPSHRKLLYTMYKMGLLNGGRTKSANVVGQTMKLNPHGDQAIYETMVRMSRGYAALLHPFVDSKGNFGKAYSRDMVCAASRYTEVKLAPIAGDLFEEIDRDTVDMVDNYDNKMKEPSLLPVRFPAILVNSNIGIAVGMASSICPFNLTEVCNTAIELLRDPRHEVELTLSGPDFPGGGYLLYDKAALDKIYKTGRGGIRVRSRYKMGDTPGCIEITEIPPSTTIEAIMDKTIDLIKLGKIREIADMRDETDLSGLKLTIDIKRGVDADKLMQKLFRMTPLEDTFSCNFNVIVGGAPKVLGVRELLEEWTAFRLQCVRRRICFDLKKCREKLHLLMGLSRVLLDIDKAVRIVRESESEKEVVPNLMIGIGIDEIQAEYVAEIKLRHLNREYILKRTEEIAGLKAQVAEMEETLSSEKKLRGVIVAELREVIKKFGQPRRTLIIHPSEDEGGDEEEEIPDYPVNLFFTEHGYFKKITPQSLRMSGEQMLKEGDTLTQCEEATNACELLFFTSKCQVYKSFCYEFEDQKASVLGDYIPAKLSMEEGEQARFMAQTRDYSGYMLFFFQNGKAAKVNLEVYKTLQKRKKLLGAISDKSPVTAFFKITEDGEFLVRSSAGRCLIVNSAMIAPKATKNTQGVAVMTLKKNAFVEDVREYTGQFEQDNRFRTKNIPAAGMLPKAEDVGEQLTL